MSQTDAPTVEPEAGRTQMMRESREIAFGDFTTSAAEFAARPIYAPHVVQSLAAYVAAGRAAPVLADVGAGTGKLAREIARLGFAAIAVEPNDSMRLAGQELADREKEVRWVKGTGENTCLDAESVDWVCVGNAFHFMDIPRALAEFSRILRPRGHLTLLWNTPDLERDPNEAAAHEYVNLLVPGVRRTYVFVHDLIERIEGILGRCGLFNDPLFIAGSSSTVMSHDRYMRSWEAIHDIPSQVSSSRWREILDDLKEFTRDRFHQPQAVTYRTTTVSVIKG
jgi:SAM-dependent methyltransferase